jgi:hypothetical protein
MTNRLRSALSAALGDRRGSADFVTYAVRWTSLRRAGLRASRKQPSISEYRIYFKRIAKSAGELASALNDRPRRFIPVLHHAYRATGGAEYVTAPLQFVFDPARQAEEIRRAAEYVLAECRDMKGQRTARLALVQFVAVLATAFEHYLKRKPSSARSGIFNNVVKAVLKELQLPTEDLRNLLERAIATRPNDLIHWSEPKAGA